VANNADPSEMWMILERLNEQFNRYTLVESWERFLKEVQDRPQS